MKTSPKLLRRGCWPALAVFLFHTSLAMMPAQVSVSITPLASFGGGDGWLTPGENGYTYLGTSSLERGMALGSNHLYLVSRNGGEHIRILDKLTGADLGELPIGSGIISGGTYTIGSVGVGADGAIYVANICQPVGASTPYNVYRWQDESSTPTLAFSSTTITGGGLGWNFDVIGSDASTRLVAGESDFNGSGARDGYVIMTTADGINYSGTLITFAATPPVSGDFQYGITFAGSNYVYGRQSDSTSTRFVMYTTYSLPSGVGTKVDSFLPTFSTLQERDMDHIVINGKAFIATISTTDSRVRIYDPTVIPFTLLATSTATSANANPWWAGSVAWGDVTNHGGLSYSANLYAMNANNGIQAFTVTLTLPCITAGVAVQPTTQTVCEGSTATFNVTASGSNPTYQWRRNGVNLADGPTGTGSVISGATTNALTISSAQVLDAANAASGYACVISVGCNSSTSTSTRVALNVNPLIPSITSQPTDKTVCAGSSATFAVTATGASPTYRWRKNGMNLNNGPTGNGSSVSGATSATLTISSTTPADATDIFGGFDCVVTAGCSPTTTTSTRVALSVNALNTTFAITGNGAYCAGEAGAQLGLSGSEPGVWYFLRTNSVPTGLRLFGIGSPLDFGFQSVPATYTVLGSNSLSGCTTLMTGSVLVTSNNPPAITSGPTPSSITNSQDTLVSIMVTATGTGLTYQWRRDGTNLSNGGNISGANLAELTIFPATPSDSGGPGHGYTCVVSGSCSPPAVSAEATVTILAFPAPLVAVWTNYYAQAGGLAVAFDSATNAIVTGAARSSLPGSHYDMLTIKYSNAGVPLWTRLYNSPADRDDVGRFVAVDGSGNAIVTGQMLNAETNYNIYTAKYAAEDGALLWERIYDSTPTNNDDYPIALALDGAGNAVVVVYSTGDNGTPSDGYLVKYAAASGAVLWEQAYVDAGPAFAWNNDHSGRLAALDGHGNIVVGGSPHFNTTKYAASNGSVLWEAIHTAEGHANAVAVDSAGNVAVTGGSGDYYTAKCASADGAVLWTHGYNGPSSAYDVPQAIAVDGSGNVVVTGLSAPQFLGAITAMYTAKYAAADGALLWEHRYIVPEGRHTLGYAIGVDGDGNVVVAGTMGPAGNENVCLVKYAGTDGTLLWAGRYDGPAHTSEEIMLCAQLAVASNGTVVVTFGSEAQCVTIMYAPSNGRPIVANAIPDTNTPYGTPFGFAFPTSTFADPNAGQSLNYTASGMPAGIVFTPATRTFSGTPTEVGPNTITVTATDDGTPPLSTNDVFEVVVTKAPLVVTAEDKSRMYGLFNPPLTLSYSGFMLGENYAWLDAPPSVITPAVFSSPVGSYPITVGGGADDHYSLIYSNGTLNVTNAPLSLTVSNASRAYGDNNPYFIGDMTGLTAGDAISVVFETPATPTSPPGNYPITPNLIDTGNRAGNYTITTNEGTLTVSNALLTVTASDASCTFSNAIPPLTGTILGLRNGDNITGNFTTPAIVGSLPGHYPITLASINDPNGRLGNYVAVINNGVLTIDLPALTIVHAFPKIVISWPITPTPLPSTPLPFLEEATGELNFVTVTSGIVQSNGFNYYTVVIDPAVLAGFYRLVHHLNAP